MLDAAALLALRNLPLVARLIAEGGQAGLHPSRRRGAGMEFSQYRPYQPGDDLRRLDWRLAARSDRYYIRESDVDTRLTVRLVLDASASMNHPDSAGVSKLDYARLLLAGLAYVAQQQGDAVGFYAVQATGLQTVPPRSDAGQLQRLYHALGAVQAAGSLPGAPTLAPLFGRQGSTVTVVLSDLYDLEEGSQLEQVLTHLRAAGGEVMVLHLLAPNELTLDYPNTATLEDLETGQRLQLDPAQRPEYQRQLEDWLRRTEQSVRGHGLDYYRLLTDEPPAQALRQVLRRRQGAPV
ncbi:DUF58 domain-containing protein [Solirubrum puertoriconensis]|uniref:DUF58 domain-containing protein n=1 Tax=Solirubrum puertoriconensis TaxID=1751427 RepID=A0A9X0HHW1_SOLP1|nr:DUF58 domain-containing protein [Solirubrum puertoriconensis]KUG06122.1 hypothetical protein ASU33_01780 [Solirubrum puertoriconensis]